MMSNFIPNWLRDSFGFRMGSGMMGGGGMMGGPRQGTGMDLLRFYVDRAATGNASVPTVLQPDNPLTPAQARRTRVLTNWRRKRHLPLKQVALDLGVAVSTISSWERGTRFPTGRHFELLVDYTGLPPCRLFCVKADQCVPPECLLAMAQKP